MTETDASFQYICSILMRAKQNRRDGKSFLDTIPSRLPFARKSLPATSQLASSSVLSASVSLFRERIKGLYAGCMPDVTESPCSDASQITGPFVTCSSLCRPLVSVQSSEHWQKSSKLRAILTRKSHFDRIGPDRAVVSCAVVSRFGRGRYISFSDARRFRVARLPRPGRPVLC